MKRRMLYHPMMLLALVLAYVTLGNFVTRLFSTSSVLVHKKPQGSSEMERSVVQSLTGSSDADTRASVTSGQPKGATDYTPVLIVAYQRGGSTFFGRIFSHDPSAFYWFEPLDGVYWSLYGIPAGFTVPSDLTTNANGSERNIPKVETKALVKVLHDIFTCNFTNLPTEVLMHRFHRIFGPEQPSIKKYLECVGEKKIDEASDCVKSIAEECPMRPVPFTQKHQTCYDTLSQKDAQGFFEEIDTKNFHVRSQSETNFLRYKTCLNKYRKIALLCVSKFKDECARSRLRVVKALRIKAEDAMNLMDSLPQLKVIHYIRHPYGITRSKKKIKVAENYMTLYSGAKFDLEAKVLCRDLYNDLMITTSAIKSKPNSYKVVVYEKLATNPNETVEDIYKYLGNSKIPQEVKTWLKVATVKSNSTAQAWMSTMTVKQYTYLRSYCDYLFTKFAEYFSH